MIATVKSILPGKYSRTESIYQRITFILEDGSWAKTDIVQGYRNSARWQAIIQSGPGTVVKNLILKRSGEVNADSYPVIVSIPLPVRAVPENPQGKLF